MTGMHYGLIPIGINNLATAGFDTVVGPGMLGSNIAQGAAALASTGEMRKLYGFIYVDKDNEGNGTLERRRVLTGINK